MLLYQPSASPTCGAMVGPGVSVAAVTADACFCALRGNRQELSNLCHTERTERPRGGPPLGAQGTLS